MAHHIVVLQTTHANRDKMRNHHDFLVVKRQKPLAEKFQLECWIKMVPTPSSMVANYKMYGEFANTAMDVMKEEITKYL